MRRSISILVAAAALAAAAAPAQAGDPVTSTSPREVYVCASDAATARSFERRHGVRPVFVTAREAADAAAAGERWEAPRCMTAREHARYTRMASERASVR